MEEQNKEDSNPEDLKSIAEEVANLKIEEPGSGRKLNIHTGIEGAKQYTRSLLEFPYTIGNRSVSEEIKEEIRQKVEAMSWEPGMYRLNPNGAEYIGLYDQEVPDGIKIVQRETQFYLEEWKGGWRKNFKKITKEEANALIRQSKKSQSKNK